MHERGSKSVDTLPGLTVRITKDRMDSSRSGDAYCGGTLLPHTNEHDLLDVLEDYSFSSTFGTLKLRSFTTAALQWQSVLGRKVNDINVYTRLHDHETRTVADCWFNGYGPVYIVRLRSTPVSSALLTKHQLDPDTELHPDAEEHYRAMLLLFSYDHTEYH
jgi:hypothetical protein